MIFGIRDLLGGTIEEPGGDTPMGAQFLDIPLQYEADPQIPARVSGTGSWKTVQYRRCRQNRNIFDTAERSDQGVRKAQRESLAVLHFAEEKKGQHGDGNQRLPRPLVRRDGRDEAVT